MRKNLDKIKRRSKKNSSDQPDYIKDKLYLPKIETYTQAYELVKIDIDEVNYKCYLVKML